MAPLQPQTKKRQTFSNRNFKVSIGFLPRRPTLTNLLVAEELITKWLDEGSAIDLMYLNFSKAFDSVNHQLLLDKLRGYGIAPIVKSWVECFRSRRTF